MGQFIAGDYPHVLVMKGGRNEGTRSQRFLRHKGIERGPSGDSVIAIEKQTEAFANEAAKKRNRRL
jgi:hypothetical protein